MFLIACAAQSLSPTNNAETLGSQALAPVNTVSSDVIRPVVGAETYPIGSSGSASNQLAQDGNLTGISVSGQGQVSGTPDLATVNLGVEAFRDTVQSARDDAAAAMESVIATLKGNGVADEDINTSRFSTHPRFDRNGQGIIGFQVSNQLTVKIRDLDMVGKIIDDVTLAGGDLTRFQGVNFSVEDSKPLEEQAHAVAIADMVAKSNQLANLSVVQLGKPYYISEAVGSSPLRVAYAESAVFDQGGGAATPIQPGKVDITIRIQAVYAIQ